MSAIDVAKRGAVGADATSGLEYQANLPSLPILDPAVTRLKRETGKGETGKSGTELHVWKTRGWKTRERLFYRKPSMSFNVVCR